MGVSFLRLRVDVVALLRPFYAGRPQKINTFRIHRAFVQSAFPTRRQVNYYAYWSIGNTSVLDTDATRGRMPVLYGGFTARLLIKDSDRTIVQGFRVLVGVANCG